MSGKKFNTTGICIPSLHYMVDTTDMIDQIIDGYIEQGEYFTINSARQFGKTTTLELLYQRLKEKYIVLDISFEAADEYFQTLGTLARGFIMDISERLRAQQVPKPLCEEWDISVSGEFQLRDFGRKITALCSKSDREVILTIYEVDKNADNQIFMSFLGLLREKYLKQMSGKDHTFKSVILAGVYDVKNLKLKLHAPEESKYNSPWNIAADFLVDMSFSKQEIEEMLQEYEQDYKTGMDIRTLAESIYDYTSGYPFLVSRICKLMDEYVFGTERFPSKKDVWTYEGVSEAVKLLLSEKNTLFESLTGKLEDYPELKKIIYAILFHGDSIGYNPDDRAIDIAFMFGFIKSKNEIITIANRIFETRLYNYFLTTDEVIGDYIYQSALQDKNQFVQNGHLNMRMILEKFVTHFHDLYGDKDEKFYEDDGRRYFLLYLRPIINGTGNYYIESQTRNRERTDVIIDYLVEQFIVELKLWRGDAYHTRGEKQLLNYLDHYHLDVGYMLSFNFNKNKKCGIQELELEGKRIFEIIFISNILLDITF